MKVSRLKEIELVTHGPNRLYDVTRELEDLSTNVKEGIIVVFSRGSTGTLIRIPGNKVEEYRKQLWDLVPIVGWQHPGNAYAHLRSTLLGTFLAIPVFDGKPALEDNLKIFFVENQPAFNRHRKIFVALITP
ncbi:MAG: hypothetical protein DRJ47_04970 [Thermoprotei archaeon]|nr:MAG: hypothetical protein DRJ47_04970 [Thermoprotei archaeon]